MIVIQKPVELKWIQENHNDFFERMVKIVVDLENKKIALNAELHADLEQSLLEEESAQENLWGANIYFENPLRIEYTSLINIRPGQGNMSMEVQDENIQNAIEALVRDLIK